MPTTINTSDLTIITRELITLGGNQYDSKHTQIIPNIKEVTKRLITVPTASIGASDTSEGIEILKITPTLLTGPYKEADIRYVRITNLDDTNFVTLQFHNDQGNITAKKLDFGGTHFYNCDMGSGSIDTIQASSNTIVDTDATVDYVSGSATVTCGANASIRPGSRLSGSSHFPTGSFVSTINTIGAVTSFDLNTPATLTGTNITTVFQVGLQDLDAIHAVADTENVDIEIFVASV
tara:strand:- start:978 stop:1685 length:708 start_codon:yes stop_codon:yes gene_type:complete